MGTDNTLVSNNGFDTTVVVGRLNDFTIPSGNSIVVGYSMTSVPANSISLGFTNPALIVNASGNVGIGTTTPSARLSVTNTVRFADITGGTLQTDALGNVTVSSDERLKDITGAYKAGLEEILGLEPIQYNWSLSSGFDTKTLYAGFSAQNVQEFLPAAVGENPDGFLTLSDRPIIAALVNAVQEIWERLEENFHRDDEQDAELTELRNENEWLKDRLEAVEAVLDFPSAQAPSVAAPSSEEIGTLTEPDSSSSDTPADHEPATPVDGLSETILEPTSETPVPEPNSPASPSDLETVSESMPELIFDS